MATRRVPTVTLYTDAGATTEIIQLTGTPAEAFINQVNAANNGGVAKFFLYRDEDTNVLHYIRYGCICHFSVEYAVEDVDERPCVLYNCLPVDNAPLPTGEA